MNFDFSDDQKLLRDSVRKFLADNCPLTHVRHVLEDETLDQSDTVWQGLCALGVVGAAIPEEYGGLGLGALELCVVAEELGRAVAPVPFSSSIYMAAEAIRLFGSAAQKSALLPQLARGEAIGTIAVAEGISEPAPTVIETRFADGKLNGVKLPVADARRASHAIVLAHSGGKGDKALSLCLVDLSDKAVTKRAVQTIDPTRGHAELQFKNAPATLLGKKGAGWENLQAIENGAAVFFAFEQVGGAEAALEMAKSYALERYAFGRQIGSYQAIKHKLADMYVKIELARSNCYYAAMTLADDRADMPLAAAAARVAASEAYRFAAQENVQTHGGIGFTWEADTQFHYRRAKLLALALGPIGRWKERLVSALEKSNAA